MGQEIKHLVIGGVTYDLPEGGGGGGGGDCNVRYNPDSDMLEIYHDGSYVGSIGAGFKASIPLVPTVAEATQYFFDDVTDSRYPFWRAFRGVDDLCGLSVGHYAGYDFQKKVTVKRIYFKNRNVAGRALGRFVLQGSDDGGNWEDVETLINTNSAANVEINLGVSATKSYQYWRILSLSEAGGTTTANAATNFCRFQFYGH